MVNTVLYIGPKIWKTIQSAIRQINCSSGTIPSLFSTQTNSKTLTQHRNFTDKKNIEMIKAVLFLLKLQAQAAGDFVLVCFFVLFWLLLFAYLLLIFLLLLFISS